MIWWGSEWDWKAAWLVLYWADLMAQLWAGWLGNVWTVDELSAIVRALELEQSSVAALGSLLARPLAQQWVGRMGSLSGVGSEHGSVIGSDYAWWVDVSWVSQLETMSVCRSGFPWAPWRVPPTVARLVETWVCGWGEK